MDSKPDDKKPVPNWLKYLMVELIAAIVIVVTFTAPWGN